MSVPANREANSPCVNIFSFCRPSFHLLGSFARRPDPHNVACRSICAEWTRRAAVMLTAAASSGRRSRPCVQGASFAAVLSMPQPASASGTYYSAYIDYVALSTRNPTNKRIPVSDSNLPPSLLARSLTPSILNSDLNGDGAANTGSSSGTAPTTDLMPPHHHNAPKYTQRSCNHCLTRAT